MAPITPRGNITAPIWVVVETPYWDQDKDKGFVFSGGYGYVFEKMAKDAGLNNYYVLARVADSDHKDTYTIVESLARQFRPHIIIPLGNSLSFFCPETAKKTKATKKFNATSEEQIADLGKYAGSLLTSNLCSTFPHYICATLPPDIIIRDWSLRDICTSLDLGKVRSELEYFRLHGHLEPLPIRSFVYDFDEPGGIHRLSQWLDRYEKSKILSIDIETVYPKAKSLLYGHPGHITVLGIADSRDEGISFRLFREDPKETAYLWRRLYLLLKRSRILGQNIIEFDHPRLECIGFEIPLSNISDTRIRHHILWPELPHKLQFLTRQYTREPYYKDEGAGWSLKDMKKLMRYNCLDVCVTFEVWEKQEEEFGERSYLK